MLKRNYGCDPANRDKQRYNVENRKPTHDHTKIFNEIAIRLEIDIFNGDACGGFIVMLTP